MIKRLTAFAAILAIPLVLWNSPEPKTQLTKSDVAATVFNLDELPSSAVIEECEGQGAITNHIVHCSGTVDPADFEALMAGWPFIERSVRNVRTRDNPLLSCQNTMDLGFQVHECLEHRTAEFEEGGHVKVFTNAERTHFYAEFNVEE